MGSGAKRLHYGRSPGRAPRRRRHLRTVRDLALVGQLIANAGTRCVFRSIVITDSGAR
jgi:hypothetical protein